MSFIIAGTAGASIITGLIGGGAARRAAGEQRLQQQQMSEAQRMQQADVSGKQFMFSTREGRELQQLNRVSAQIGNAQANEAQARADQTAAFTGMANSLVQVGGAAIASTGDQ